MRSWSEGLSSTYHHNVVPNITRSSAPCFLPMGILSLGFLQTLASSEVFLIPFGRAPGTSRDQLGRAEGLPLPKNCFEILI